jgi:hypothetical protein
MPQVLPPCRRPRYLGELERVTLDSFAPEDQRLLARVYHSLLSFFTLLKPHTGDFAKSREVISQYLRGDGSKTHQMMAQLGRATAVERPTVPVDRLIHDLRGGAFQALSFRLQLIAAAPEKEAGLSQIYFLLRDHLKIMRNCVADLDPERFSADSQKEVHDVSLLVEKWAQADFCVGPHPVRVHFNTFFHGTLCESCLEFSSLDRMIYNLMNNASRHASDRQIYFNLIALPPEEPRHLRFVIVNRVSAEHRAAMQQQFGDDPGELFRGGYTTDGHGQGARICADFCTHAHGLSHFNAAKDAGYFGARWIDDYLAVWFHWPIVDPNHVEQAPIEDQFAA